MRRLLTLLLAGGVAYGVWLQTASPVSSLPETAHAPTDANAPSGTSLDANDTAGHFPFAAGDEQDFSIELPHSPVTLPGEDFPAVKVAMATPEASFSLSTDSNLLLPDTFERAAILLPHPGETQEGMAAKRARSAEALSLPAELVGGDLTGNEPLPRSSFGATPALIASISPPPPVSLIIPAAASRTAMPAVAEPSDLLTPSNVEPAILSPASSVRQAASFESSESLPPGVEYPEGAAVLNEPGRLPSSMHASAIIPVNATSDDLITRPPLELLGRDPAEASASVESAFVTLPLTADLAGWEIHDGQASAWQANGELVTCRRGNGGWLRTRTEYSDFELQFEVLLGQGANTGVAFRCSGTGSPSATGIEVQLLDETAPKYASLRADQRTGSFYYLLPPTEEYKLTPGVWHSVRVLARGEFLSVEIDGIPVNEVSLDQLPAGEHPHPLRARGTSGFIGFQSSAGEVHFRRIQVRDLVTWHSSGIGILELASGLGEECNSRSLVTLDYVVRGDSAQADDSEASSAGTHTFDLRSAPLHWKVGLPGMRTGGRRKLIVPSGLNEHVREDGELPIDRSATIFEVELRGVER